MLNRPPIFIISLTRAMRRRESVSAAFRSAALPFEFIDAVDGSALTPEQRARYSNWRALFEMGSPLGQGMFGASLSHLGVYERMVTENLPVVAVFEDDVEPSPDLELILESVPKLPEDWQVVTLHSLFPSSRPRPVDAPPIVPGRQVCTYERVPFGLQGYLINLSGARRVLEVAYPVAFPPDEILFRRHPAGLSVYGIEPSPLVHRGVMSEIHSLPVPLVPGRALRRPVDRAVLLAGKAHLRVWKGVDALRSSRRSRGA
jgi:glycosyl transferase, family 25